ncbi:MAG: DUF1926 domain-containing protein [Planctomycetes bacterium]|nr:DUF1926 domain-containing protein [Planctomycetota bacterium]
MPATIHFAFAIHNHQPIGNFDNVIAAATNDAYAPFLEVLAAHPAIRCGIHVSGCLLDWLTANRPDLCEILKRGVEEGRIEIVGGGYYEPILPMLPERDRQGQIKSFAAHLKRVFGTEVTGAWLAERVWEQPLAATFAEAGVRYTFLDDFHFRTAGADVSDLTGYYMTEDQGKSVAVFPILEELRYAIPFKEPQETIDLLRRLATPDGRRLVVYADDGEKFGVWPRTKKHCYGEDRWLDRFFSMLEANRDWITLVTPREALERLPPAGRIYLPDCSYREMTEWVLPTARQHALEEAHALLKRGSQDGQATPFLRGGFWRNFRVKYSEANAMHARMERVSELVDALPRASRESRLARVELYRGQCNCAYWHGVFGGLYLPHLRNAVYTHLLRAEEHANRYLKRGKTPLVEVRDLDHDGHPEVNLLAGGLEAVLSPQRGGHLVELDLLAKHFNVTACLARRTEAYHRKVSQARVVKDLDTMASIHDLILAKEEGLDKRLAVDPFPRESLIDHFFVEGTTIESLDRGSSYETGDFAAGAYTCHLPAVGAKARAAEVSLERQGTVVRDGTPYAVAVWKTVRLEARKSRLEAAYTITNRDTRRFEATFGVEWNFNFLAPKDADRSWIGPNGDPLGMLGTTHSLAGVSRFGVRDDWQGIAMTCDWDVPADLWCHPVETVSQSEGGFERVYQGSAVVPHWRLALPPGASWRVKIGVGFSVK